MPLPHPCRNADRLDLVQKNHSCCELVSAAVLLCPEGKCFFPALLTLVSYNLSVSSSMMLPKLWGMSYKDPIYEWIPHRHLPSALWSVVSLCINYCSLEKKLLWWRVRVETALAEDNTYFGQQTGENQAISDLEALFFLACIHSPRRCSIGCWRIKIKIFTQLWTLWDIVMLDLATYTHAATVSTNVIDVSKPFLIGFKICGVEGNSCLVL